MLETQKSGPSPGIDESTERLLQTYNIPMDCYLLSTMIAVNIEKHKFWEFLHDKKGNISKMHLFQFILLFPVILMIMFSGLIVFCIQTYILFFFVGDQEKNQKIDPKYFPLKLILVIIFALMIFGDYANGSKKFVIGAKMPTLRGKIITILLSFFQSLVTLIVYFCGCFVIQHSTSAEDLVQNFTAIYVVIKIDEAVYNFYTYSNILGCLAILGLKKENISYFKKLKFLWRLKKKHNIDIDQDLINLGINLGQAFFYCYVAGVIYLSLFMEYDIRNLE